MVLSGVRGPLQRLNEIGTNPPGAGTPAPSAAAISDAERYAAQQRIVNGSRDPKDRHIINEYLLQQNTPKSKPQSSLDDLEFRRSLPNIVKMARATSGDESGGRVDHEFGPVQIDIRHHQNGRATVAARGGTGTKLSIKSGPTMQMA